MKRIKSLAAILILVSLAGCNNKKQSSEPIQLPQDVTSKLSGSFSIGGAYALYPLIERLAEDFMTLHPDVSIEVVKTGTGAGVAGLISNQYDLAMTSRQLTDEEASAGIFVIQVAKDGVAPIVNQQNPYLGVLLDQGLSTDEFLRIFTSGNVLTWGEILKAGYKEQVNVFTRGDESGAADIWAGFIYRDRTALKGTGVEGDDEMIRRIQGDRFAIGYCNLSYAFDSLGKRISGIQIVPVDLDFDNKVGRSENPFKDLETAHRSLWLGYYPKSLCRELAVCSLGKPADLLIIEFLRYVLGEGQRSIKKAGFCELNNVYIRHSLQNLE